MMIILTVSVLMLAAAHLVSAMPFAQVTKNLPRDVTHIAHDEDHGVYHAYKRDGSLYGTYSADVAQHVEDKRDGDCFSLSVQQVQILPGFNKIEDYAKSNWGNKKHRLVTNPSEFPDDKAVGCTKAPGSCHFIASGWIWYFYDDRVQDHYKWAVSIDQVLPDEGDRSSVVSGIGQLLTCHDQSTMGSQCVVCSTRCSIWTL